MLVLTRRLKEGVVIQDNIIVTVLAIEGDRVKLGITAPRAIAVLRLELCEAVREQNLAAARMAREAIRAQSLQSVRQLLKEGSLEKHVQ